MGWNSRYLDRATRGLKWQFDGWDGSFTYEELDQLSSRIASHLQVLGIGPQMMIPSCFGMSSWSIIATIGVHKTGAAFVPLDPALPMKRIQKLMAAVECSFVLVSPMQNCRFESVSATRIIISPQVVATFPPADTLRQSKVSTDDRAYCLFTSGSSGAPKGCVVSQRAFAGIPQQGATARLTEKSRSFQFASYSFGLSINEIYCTLGVAGTVCVVPDEDCAGISNLASAITRLNANWTFMTSTMIGSLRPKDVLCLETKGTAGEPLQKAQVEMWASACPGREHGWWTPDNDHFLAPVGAVGELGIEGPCLAEGYLNDPDKTSRAFIAHPGWGRKPLFPTDAGSERLYKTGDLVRYMCDGSIQFLARKDTQRKVRGERIQISEVEYHVKTCFPEAVRVLAKVLCPRGDDPESGQVLTAFLQFHQPATGANDARDGGENWFAPVNQALQDRFNVAREALFHPLAPLNRRHPCIYANKLTRHELLGKNQMNGPSRAPSTEMETVLVTFVAKVLKTSVINIGVDDNFFHLGGDSIKAMALVGLWQIGRMACASHKPATRGVDWAVEPFSQLLEYEPKDEVIRESCRQCHVDEAMIEDIYPCTPLQEGMFALGRKQAGGYVARWVYEIQQMSETDMQRLRNAWARVFEDSATLRTRIVATPSQRMYQVLLREKPVWQESDSLFYRDERDEKPDLLVDFGQPLAKMSIHRNGTSHCLQLVLTMHHSVIDGWCFRKILDQVEKVYHANSLPASPPFATFVNYLRQLPDHKAYWTDYFSGLNAEAFPTILPLSYEPCPTGEAIEWLSLSNFDPGRFTRSAVLRLAWAMVQSQYQGNHDIVYGVTVPTLATMPFRVQLDPAASIEKALDGVIAQTVRSIPHEQTGLQNMRKWGGDIAAACNFQTLLVIQHVDSTKWYSLLGVEPQQNSFAAFCTYSLTLICDLNPDPVELQLKHIVKVICKAPTATINDCMTVNPSDIEEIFDGWDVQFTYQALDELSTNLAKHLLVLGVGPGDFVEKSGWTVVCMFAVIKSGAAFILLDPTIPKQRLACSCQQAKSQLLLTTTATLPVSLELMARVVLADDQYPARKNVSLPAICPDWPLFAQVHFSSYAFDMSVNETLWMVLGGGCIRVPSDSQRMNDFVGTVTTFRPTHAMLTPSFMRTLEPKDFPTLRWLMTAGEPTQPSEITAWSSCMELLIGYGPAECGVTHLRYVMESPIDPYSSVGFLTGGANWLVAPGNPEKLLPIGAVGELLLGGPFVGPGYVHNAAKTQEVFIPEPSYVKKLRRGPSRVYRTDSQVKIRGQRIVLADVETHLAACFSSSVQVVVELVSPKSHGAPFLVAFIHTPMDQNQKSIVDASATIASCRAFYQPEQVFHEQATEGLARLRDRIPRFMIPSMLINLSYMPQTTSRKVDRKYLRKALAEMPEEELRQFRTGIESKRGAATNMEKKIQAFCTAALQIPCGDVGLENNFLQLGGDSISAMYMVAEARKDGIQMNVTDVLDNPRLSTLASYVTCRSSSLSNDNHTFSNAEIKAFTLIDNELREEATRHLLRLQIGTRRYRPRSKLAPLRFTLVSRSATEHAFIISLSHAQYDGISMPTLTKALREAYSGGKPESMVDFATYMHFRSLHDHTAAFDFWREYLLNSSVRPLSISSKVAVQKPSDVSRTARITAGQNIPTPKLPAGLTVASLVEAAAARIFTRDGRQNDIILGQVVSGRILPIVDIEKVLGPCLNTIPFRVKLQPRWTVLDLLQHVQKQCSSTFAYDYVELADIVRASTDWSEESYLPCVIQHQNVAQTFPLPLTDVECTSTGWVYFIPPSGMWILSSPQGSNLQLMLCTSGAFMSLETARSWVKDLAAAITLFVSQPEMILDDLHI
ncbi:hypothetical protein CNMCM8980_001762 [Aspergillus fumigatiaffinis]|nr:hypothetical protein CNMCM8980_001762 [Aspergillus fumigatiaffinis]